MAALLVAMSVMAILLTVALPTWKQTVQREKEEELVFRGTQYVRAIGAYQRKYANASPQSIDVLIEQHFLRKKFKDPLSPAEDGEFQPLYASTQTAQGGQGGRAAGTGTLASTTPSGGGIIGVASKNTGLSIRTYKNATHYNEWQFIGLQQTQQAGGGGQGTQGRQGGTQGGQGGQGGRGGRQGGQGGQGTQGQRGQGSQGGGSQPQRGGSQGRGTSQTQGR